MAFTRHSVRERIAVLVAIVATSTFAFAGSAVMTSSPAGAATPMYYLALGDYMAYGTGASGPQYDYVNLVYQHERLRIEGLQLENLSCAGETTTSMIDGPGCTEQTQLASAEAFLEAHPGQVAFATMDLGANDYSACVEGSTVDMTCVNDTLDTINTNIPEVLSGLSAAYPDLQLFGMNYYDPYLAAWLNGGDDETAAESTVPYFDQLNSALSNDYTTSGFSVADVASTFQTDDSDLTGSYSAQTVPQNVADVCNWTHMCGFLYTQPNNTGHAEIAGTFEPLIDAATEVTACDPPGFTSPGTATATAGVPFTFTVSTCTTAVPRISAAHLPPGLRITNNEDGTASITGTPAPKDSGVYAATLTALVPSQAASSQTLDVTVENAPTFRSVAKDLVHTGLEFSYPITTVYGYPTPSILTASALPGGVSLVDEGNGTAILGGTPNADVGGAYVVTIAAQNSVTTVDQTFTLTVYQAPVVTSAASDTVDAGAPMTPFSVTTTGYPLAKVTGSGLPSGVHLVNNGNGTGTITGTPKAAAVSNTYSVTITASSKAGTTHQTFMLSVNPG